MPMPMIVVLPLLSLWFGYTGGARLATIMFAAIFSDHHSTSPKARARCRSDYLEVARSFCAGRLAHRCSRSCIPAATPYLLAGLTARGRPRADRRGGRRILHSRSPGLGYFILFNSRTFHHDDAFVAVLLLAGFGVGCDGAIGGATRRFLPWYRRDEARE